MLDKSLRRNGGHIFVGLMNSFSSVKSEPIGNRVGEVARVRGRELVGVGHRSTIAEACERSKNVRTAIIVVAMLLASAACAQSPEISARRLLSSWKGADPDMRMVAEMIASTFASGFAWGGEAAGKHVYCASPDLKGREIMSAFERFLQDNPDMAEKPYGDAMSATLSRAFPCRAL